MYVIVIAVNGITECFAMATMNQQQVFYHGWFLFCICPVHILLCSALSYFIGVYGLIFANIINMLTRITYSWRHIQRFLSGKISFAEALPNSSTVVVLLFCLAVTSLSLLIFGGVGGIMHSAAHAAVGGSLFVFTVSHIYQNDVHVARCVGKLKRLALLNDDDPELKANSAQQDGRPCSTRIRRRLATAHTSSRSFSAVIWRTEWS
ncbi:unnamed protein product [Gongylonema pulchrum]|uniref:Protein RFT1 homolog n=1 Tax=Gongylonema pulchrum TaxID=637853 RepID=A0A183DVZ3_9BILA|nr:unnamed protein product [Gongylonema pulchrum]